MCRRVGAKNKVYLDLVLANHAGGTAEDIKTENLVNAIKNYAHYAQIALDETHTEYTVGEEETYKGTEARTAVTLKAVEEFARFAAIKTVAEGYTAITAISRTLVLDDETAIVINLTPANAEYEPASP